LPAKWKPVCRKKPLLPKIARILIAKSVPTFAKYALKPIFSVLNF